jgi:hypothetical protein
MIENCLTVLILVFGRDHSDLKLDEYQPVSCGPQIQGGHARAYQFQAKIVSFDVFACSARATYAI